MSRASRSLAMLSAVLAAVALVALRPSGEPGVFMRDFEAYYSAGSTWLAHGNPYTLDIWNAQAPIPGVVASRHEALPFVGLPATLPFWALFARVPYAAAAHLWAALLALSLAALVVATSRLLALSRGTIVAAALVALTFVPITSDFGLGQAALPAYAAAVVALTIPPLISTIAIVAAALQPNVALGLLALFFSRTTAVAAIVAAVLVAVLSAWAAGPGWISAYVSTLAAHSAAERFAAIQYTPAAVLYGFSVPQSIAALVGIAIAAIAIAIAVTGMIRVRALAHRFAIASCAVPFVAGFFHEHDFVVLFVPVVLAALYAKRVALVPLAVLLAGVNWLDFAQQPAGRAQDIAFALAVFSAAAAIRPTRGHLWSAAASVAFLIFGAWLGAAHSLPIWPNDMAGVAHGATIAELWKNEQLQTGLLRPDAAAALLRTFALLGSALLMYLVLDIDVHHVVERRDRVRMEVL